MNSMQGVCKFAALFAFKFTVKGCGLVLAVHRERSRAGRFCASVYLAVALISAKTFVLIL